MAHPHKAEAHSSSRDKFKAITGVSGGGHAYHGSSHLKKPGTHGIHKHWSGHAKTHILEGKAHGGKSHPRADRRARGGPIFGDEPRKLRTDLTPEETKKARSIGDVSNKSSRDPFPANRKEPEAFIPSKEQHRRGGKAYARGGRTKRGAPENVTINITQRPDQGMRPSMPPPVPPPAPPAGGGAPPAAPPMPPASAGAPAGGANPMQGLGKGLGFARGGRARGSHGARTASAGHSKGPSVGDSNYDLAHWRNYAGRQRQQRAEGFVQGHTQGVGKVQERAAGGRLKMTAGAQSGIGRLQKMEHHKR